jgi:DNA-binding transcriptional ArsR family regulator
VGEVYDLGSSGMARAQSSSDVFHAIADPTRRALLDILSEGEKPVSSLCEQFDVAQPAISQHLRVLREVGLVTEKRVGKYRIYRLEPAPLAEVHEWINHYERFWRSKLHALANYLDDTHEKKHPN